MKAGGGSVVRASILGLAMLAVWHPPADAQENMTSANYQLPHCKAYLAEQDGNDFLQGACVGIIRALLVTGNLFAPPNQFCVPKGVTVRQAVRVVVQHIESRPSYWHNDFTVLAVGVLSATWPCPG